MFVTDLVVREVDDNKDELLQELVYYSAVFGGVIRVPVGFVTDYASVPRLPFVYLFFGGRGKKAAVIHDYLYSLRHEPREVADKVFLEAMQALGMSSFTAYPMYAAVRAWGWTRYQTQKEGE